MRGSGDSNDEFFWEVLVSFEKQLRHQVGADLVNVAELLSIPFAQKRVRDLGQKIIVDSSKLIILSLGVAQLQVADSRLRAKFSHR